MDTYSVVKNSEGVDCLVANDIFEEDRFNEDKETDNKNVSTLNNVV